MLRVSEVAARLKCSLSTVYQLIACGELPSHHVCMRKGIRVAEPDLRDYLDRCRTADRSAARLAPKRGGTKFTHINGERLRAAWLRQGVLSDQTSEGSARSSESSYGPSAPTGS